MGGPPPPNIQRLLHATCKHEEEVAHAMQIPLHTFNAILAGEDHDFVRWAMVFAKAAHMSNRGLMKLLNRDTPRSAQSATDCAVLKFNTYGETIYQALVLRPSNIMDAFRLHVTRGWPGFDFPLESADVDSLFAGTHVVAEHVGSMLFKLAQATDPTRLFAIFVPAPLIVY